MLNLLKHAGTATLIGTTTEWVSDQPIKRQQPHTHTHTHTQRTDYLWPYTTLCQHVADLLPSGLEHGYQSAGECKKGTGSEGVGASFTLSLAIQRKGISPSSRTPRGIAILVRSLLMKSTKSLLRDVFDIFATHSGLIHDVTHSDFCTQNGSTNVVFSRLSNIDFW